MISPIIIPIILAVGLSLFFGDPNQYQGLGELGLLIPIVLTALFSLGAMYLSFSRRLFHLAREENLDKSWMAFVPFVQFYLIGLLIKEKINPVIATITLSVATLFTSLIPMIFLSNDIMVFFFINTITATFFFQLRFLYKRYNLPKPTAKAIWSVIFPGVIPFLIPRNSLTIRKDFIN